MRKTVWIIQIIIVTAGLLACVFFIGLHKKTQGNEKTIVNAVDNIETVSETDLR